MFLNDTNLITQLQAFAMFSSIDLESHEVRRDLKDNIILEDNGTQWYNLTDSTAASNSSSNVVVGFIGAAVAIVFFGSNLVPVKKADTGDGKNSWAQFHGSAYRRILRLRSRFPAQVQAPNFCASLVSVECLVTWSTHAQKQKFTAIP